MQLKWNRILGLAAAAALGIGATGIASAQTAGSSGMGGTDMTTLDSDQDGKVSKKEAGKNKELSKKFESLDINKDGKLDSGEFSLFEGAAPATTTPAPGGADPFK